MGKDAETIRRGYEAFNTADLKTLTELFDADASWHMPGRSPLAGDYKDRESTFGLFGQLGQQTGGTFRAELQRLLADDEGCVISVHRSRGERNGKHLDVECCLVFELKNGKVTGAREHYDDLYAWDEFWA